MAKTKTHQNLQNTRFLDRLRAKIADLPNLTRQSMQKFQAFARALGGQSVSGNEIMADRTRLYKRMDQTKWGHLTMFYYDPKWKHKLPYYDTFPLVIPLQPAKGGFLGLNLHYLPPGHRAVVMDMLYNSSFFPGRFDVQDDVRIRIDYQKIKALLRNRFYVPCIKHYLYSHTKSSFFLVPPQDWDSFLFLPTERFVKWGKSAVQKESIRKIKGLKPRP